MASSVLYLGLNFGGPFHFETGLHVTTTTVSAYGIYRYFTCLLSDSDFLQKERNGNISCIETNTSSTSWVDGVVYSVWLL
jgi:hypothetical protein